MFQTSQCMTRKMALNDLILIITTTQGRLVPHNTSVNADQDDSCRTKSTFNIINYNCSVNPVNFRENECRFGDNQSLQLETYSSAPWQRAML